MTSTTAEATVHIELASSEHGYTNVTRGMLQIILYVISDTSIHCNIINNIK